MQQGQEVRGQGLHQGKGGGNKRDEERALNSIELQKEAAARRGSCEHGVSSTGVSLHSWSCVHPTCLAEDRALVGAVEDPR